MDNRLQSSIAQGDICAERLESALSAAQECLLQQFERTDVPIPSPRGEGVADVSPDEPVMQKAGYWCAELEADSTLEADYILFLYLLNPEAYADKIAKLGRCIVRGQLPCGAWNIYHGGPGDLSASVKAYVALKIAGYLGDSPVMRIAREAILRLGGAENANSFTKIYLAILNQYDWDDVPALPPEIVLLPKFFYFNIYEISYWSRAILIPLSILYAKRPRAAIGDTLSIGEIFLNDTRRSVVRRKTDAPRAGAGKNVGASGSGLFALLSGRRRSSRSRRRWDDAVGAAELASGDPQRGPVPRTRTGLDSRASNGHAANGAYSNGAHANSKGGVHAHGTNGNGHVAHVGSVANGHVAAGRGKRGQPIPRSVSLFSWRNFFIVVDRVLKIVEKTPMKPLRGLALKKAEEWMVHRLQDSDGLGAIFPSMVNSVLAMRCLGYGEDHPLVVGTLDKLCELEIEEDGEIRLQPCLSPVWDTALAVNALQESDLPRNHPTLVEAARWLVAKEVRRPGDWQVRAPGVEISGWAFQFQNDFYPDIDDTAAVLMALERVDLEDVPGIRQSIARGLNWMVSLQCSNGGWAAFDVNVERAALTHVPYADHNAMLDPACADITGRVLEAIGRFPLLASDPWIQASIRRGVEYLKKTQEADGSWYGRWGVNYIYGTWQALKGLITVGEDPQQESIRRAIDFLKRHQHPDGGWGESPSSYDAPEHKADVPSTASQTAWAVMGLIAAGEIDSAAVRRGVQYLLDTQGTDGDWEEEHWTGTGFPSVFYLKYHLYSLYFPLFALGYYRNVRLGLTTIRERSDIPWRHRADDRGSVGGSRGGLKGLFNLARQ